MVTHRDRPDPIAISRVDTGGLMREARSIAGLTQAQLANGYETFAEGAVSYDIDGLIIPVASLENIITSKRAAGRPKDLAVLPILEALQDEIADRERQNPMHS